MKKSVNHRRALFFGETPIGLTMRAIECSTVRSSTNAAPTPDKKHSLHVPLWDSSYRTSDAAWHARAIR